jgi:hypothetical protein
MLANFNFQPHFSLIEYFSVCKLIWVRAGERMLHRGIETMQRR